MVVTHEELNSSTVLNKRKGPMGLGDPEDKSLRKVEIEILIPKKMRDKARNEKCSAEVEDFNKCCIANGITMVYNCRNENKRMQACLTYWYQNEEFKNSCKEEYLEERSYYRKTGIGIKYKLKDNT